MLDTSAHESHSGAGRHESSDERILSEQAEGLILPAGASEVEQLARNGAVQAVAIDPDWSDLIAQAPQLGRVRTVARNAHAIHKSWGEYGGLRGGTAVGLVINGGIDLRMFYRAWKYAYVVEAPSAGGTRLSLEIFDENGAAVQKVFPETAKGQELLRTWASCHGHDAGTPAVSPQAPAALGRPDAEIDGQSLLDEWQDLKDVHHFRAMIERHGASRTQALRLARGRFATAVEGNALQHALGAAHEGAVPIMVFLANRGIVQIHSGPVGPAERADGWLHLVDPGFHLHVRETGIAESWVVSKPTADGPVTSLELYDAAGEQILQIFGVRQEGTRENPAWQALANGLARPS